jgi:hypothetical protein
LKRLALVLALATAGCAAGGSREQFDGPPLKPSANPSAVIAAELAFSQLAQTKGQWTAFRETAAPDAEMFVPQRTKAAAWLKGRADPALAVKWQPQAVWSSCDGSFAVTRGEWQRPGSAGAFATVWERQKKTGTYKWVLDMSLTDEENARSAEMVQAIVADCNGEPLGVAVASADASGKMADSVTASSDDGTLSWTSTVFDNGARHFVLRMWKDGDLREVLAARVPAE